MLPISAGLRFILSRKEKAAKEEVGAEAGLPWLAGWAVCDPPRLPPTAAIRNGSAASRGPRHRIIAGPRGRSAHPDSG